MPRGGKNHAQGGEIAQGGGNFARASRAQDSIFLPPLTNFSCTPLSAKTQISGVLLKG